MARKQDTGTDKANTQRPARKTARKTARATASRGGGARTAPAKKKSAKASGRSTQQARAQRAGGAVDRLVGSARELGKQAGRTAGTLAAEGADRASRLGAKAQQTAGGLLRRGRKFVQDHPAETAGLAAAGLTLAAAALGRRRIGSRAGAEVASVVAQKASGMATRTGEALKGLGERLK